MLEFLTTILSQYKYLVLFPLAIVEGPILAVIAGLLCTYGILNPFLVYPLIVLGDITGDSICYLLGRWGKSKRLGRIGKLFGLHAEKMDHARTFFDANPIKTISLSKIILGIGVTGIWMAGNARVPYFKFLLICLVTSAIQYTIYLSIGLMFGHAYVQINHYLNKVASVCIITALALLLFFTVRSMLKKP